LAIYIHWPYCESKCPYCDFNSYAKRTITEDQFLASVNRELDHYAARTFGRAISTIFFGGGTPSLMPPATVTAILDRVSARWPVHEDCEITLEANPSSVEAGRFAGYRSAGVNRVSLGVQSLRDEDLRFLGRLHSAAEARRAIEIANATFERVSFDLIYARQGQSAADWRQELKEALALARGHLSLYQLTIEPGTAFFDLEARGKLRIPESGDAADLYELTQEMCEAAGLAAYEISNHARPGEESRHNLVYWRYGDYLGIGPGAHGRLTLDGGKIATSAFRSPQAWRDAVERIGHGVEESTQLTPREQAEEMLLMGFRLSEGLSLSKIETETNLTLNDCDLRQSQAFPFLRDDAGRIAVSKEGRLLLNAVVKELAGILKPPVEPNIERPPSRRMLGQHR